MKKFIILFIFIACGLAVVFYLNSNVTHNLSKDLVNDPIASMEQELEDIRRELKIPGMAAAIGIGDSIVWSRGFGWADIELGIPVTKNSLFQLASLTKPYATTIILQLVQEGKLDLNTPVSHFGLTFENSPEVLVWHLLSHTSSARPGTVFKYDGRRFGQLEEVIEATTGNSFASEIRNRILKPLDLQSTFPNPLDTEAFRESGANYKLIEEYFVTEYAKQWGRVIWPSGLFGPLKPIDYPDYFGTSAGMIATAADVIKFSASLDNGFLLNQSLYNLSLTPVRGPDGNTFPFGFGWFLETFEGHQIAWQYGHWFGSSSLIIKVPQKKFTMVILANSDGLSRMTRIGDKATINASPLAPIVLQRILKMNELFELRN